MSLFLQPSLCFCMSPHLEIASKFVSLPLGVSVPPGLLPPRIPQGDSELYWNGERE